MVNAIPGRNLLVLNFAFHLPRQNGKITLILICSCDLCEQNIFSKANCFCVYRMLITRSTHAKCLLSSFWFYPIANGFTDVPSIKPDHSTWNMTWVLIQILLSCVAFFSAVFRFSSFTCIPIQSFSGRFFFLHFSTLPRPDFPGSHGAEKHYRLVLFWARALQSFYILCFLSPGIAYANFANFYSAASGECISRYLKVLCIAYKVFSMYLRGNRPGAPNDCFL